MELNSIHQAILKIRELHVKSEISTQGAADLLAEMELADRYFTAYFYNPKVGWHEVKANPSKYPMQGEIQRILFKAAKANEDVEAVIKKVYGL